VDQGGGAATAAGLQISDDSLFLEQIQYPLLQHAVIASDRRVGRTD